MPVISASVIDKNGSIVLARQFTDITRVRIEGLLYAFPRLRESSEKKQATFLDAGSVRYVYQPMESFFLVLITTLDSNIVEDLATLQLMSKVISGTLAESVSKQLLQEKTFPILFAFDEIIVGGKKECASLKEVQTCLAMYSEAEIMYKQEKERQMEEARKVAAEHVRSIKEAKMMGLSRGQAGPYGGFGSDSNPYQADFDTNPNESYGMRRPNTYEANSFQQAYSAPVEESPVMPQRGVGMSLGGAKKSSRVEVSMMAQVSKEISSLKQKPGASRSAPPAPPAEAPRPDQTAKTGGGQCSAVQVTAVEKMNVELTRDGEVKTMDVKGALSLCILEAHCGRVLLELKPLDKQAFTYKAHAKMNKAQFAEQGILAMSDGKPFPLQQNLTVLRWRAAQAIAPPVLFTCWPETGRMTVEYEFVEPHCTLDSLSITIPLNGETVTSLRGTSGSPEQQGDAIVWSIPVRGGEASQTGSVDIAVDSNVDLGEVMFPMTVSIQGSSTMANVCVNRVIELDTEMPVRFAMDTQLVAESYIVE